MNIQVIAASALPTPPTDERTLFINTEDSNILSWMNSARTVTRFGSSSSDGGCCACDIAKDYADAISCALKNGLLTDIQVKSLITLGFTVNEDRTDDGQGNTTCTVTFGATNIS